MFNVHSFKYQRFSNALLKNPLFKMKVQICQCAQTKPDKWKTTKIVYCPLIPSPKLLSNEYKHK